MCCSDSMPLRTFKPSCNLVDVGVLPKARRVKEAVISVYCCTISLSCLFMAHAAHFTRPGILPHCLPSCLSGSTGQRVMCKLRHLDRRRPSVRERKEEEDVMELLEGSEVIGAEGIAGSVLRHGEFAVSTPRRPNTWVDCQCSLRTMGDAGCRTSEKKKTGRRNGPV